MVQDIELITFFFFGQLGAHNLPDCAKPHVICAGRKKGVLSMTNINEHLEQPPKDSVISFSLEHMAKPAYSSFLPGTGIYFSEL